MWLIRFIYYGKKKHSRHIIQQYEQKNISLKNLCIYLSKKFNLTLYYNLSINPTVSIKLINQELKEVIESLANKFNFQYIYNDKILCLKEKTYSKIHALPIAIQPFKQENFLQQNNNSSNDTSDTKQHIKKDTQNIINTKNNSIMQKNIVNFVNLYNKQYNIDCQLISYDDQEGYCMMLGDKKFHKNFKNYLQQIQKRYNHIFRITFNIIKIIDLQNHNLDEILNHIVTLDPEINTVQAFKQFIKKILYTSIKDYDHNLRDLHYNITNNIVVYGLHNKTNHNYYGSNIHKLFNKSQYNNIFKNSKDDSMSYIDLQTIPYYFDKNKALLNIKMSFCTDNASKHISYISTQIPLSLNKTHIIGGDTYTTQITTTYNSIWDRIKSFFIGKTTKKVQALHLVICKIEIISPDHNLITDQYSHQKSIDNILEEAINIDSQDE